MLFFLVFSKFKLIGFVHYLSFLWCLSRRKRKKKERRKKERKEERNEGGKKGRKEGRKEGGKERRKEEREGGSDRGREEVTGRERDLSLIHISEPTRLS